MDGDLVLVVEDSKLFSGIIVKEIRDVLGMEALLAENLNRAMALATAHRQEIFLALLDLNLPDAPNGEIVDHILELKIPVIVFTGEFDDEIREQMIAKKVIDYVVKESPSSIDYVINLVRRISRNRTTKVLVVDDSRSARKYTAGLLAIHQYRVLETENGSEALRVIGENRDIKLVITDFNMPEMDGFQLIKRIRLRHERDRMAIIGLSAYGNNIISAKFIKNGANDFINKPFLEEEFFCRVSQNVENIENLEALRNAATRDFLTGLANRRYFMDAGAKLFASARRGQIQLSVALVDIDKFKAVNDAHGHDTGDEVLRRIAKILEDQFRSTDIVSRFGGEEFCILMVNMEPASAPAIFEQTRQFVAEERFTAAGTTFSVTISIGICVHLRESLHDMVNRADELLYRAKHAGRNRIEIEKS